MSVTPTVKAEALNVASTLPTKVDFESQIEPLLKSKCLPWRGTGDVESPFFERYRFENETTLAVDSFTDETLMKVEDTTRFVLKDGQFGNGGEGSRWVATRIDLSRSDLCPFCKGQEYVSLAA